MEKEGGEEGERRKRDGAAGYGRKRRGESLDSYMERGEENPCRQEKISKEASMAGAGRRRERLAGRGAKVGTWNRFGVVQ